jgi:hypothetical protein
MAELINRLIFTLINLNFHTSKKHKLYVAQANLVAMPKQGHAKLFGKINITLERFFNLADWKT